MSICLTIELVLYRGSYSIVGTLRGGGGECSEIVEELKRFENK